MMNTSRLISLFLVLLFTIGMVNETFAQRRYQRGPQKRMLRTFPNKRPTNGVAKNSTSGNPTSYSPSRTTGQVGNGQPVVIFHKIYTEHEVYQNGQKGLKIHLEMNVNGAEGQSCTAVVYFFYENGAILMDRNGSYKSSSGYAITREKFTPRFPSSHFKDMVLFMPYNELHISGTHRLKYRITIRSNGKEVNTSPDRYFNIKLNSAPISPKDYASNPRNYGNFIVTLAPCRNCYSYSVVLEGDDNRRYEGIKRKVGNNYRFYFDKVLAGAYTIRVKARPRTGTSSSGRSLDMQQERPPFDPKMIYVPSGRTEGEFLPLKRGGR